MRFQWLGVTQIFFQISTDFNPLCVVDMSSGLFLDTYAGFPALYRPCFIPSFSLTLALYYQRQRQQQQQQQQQPQTTNNKQQTTNNHQPTTNNQQPTTNNQQQQQQQQEEQQQHPHEHEHEHGKTLTVSRSLLLESRDVSGYEKRRLFRQVFNPRFGLKPDMDLCLDLFYPFCIEWNGKSSKPHLHSSFGLTSCKCFLANLFELIFFFQVQWEFSGLILQNLQNYTHDGPPKRTSRGLGTWFPMRLWLVNPPRATPGNKIRA